MYKKFAGNTAVLSLVVVLSACGGSGPDGVDGTVDPVAGDAALNDPAAVAEPVADAVEGAISESAENPVDGLGGGWIAMQDNWESSAGLVKDRWADLGEEEILGTGGDRDQLVVLLQETYGIDRAQAEQEVNDWAASM